MIKMIQIACISCILMILSGCAAINPSLKHPEVKLAGLRLLPAQGMLQRQIAIDLVVTNPNRQDLSVRSMTYNVEVEGIKLLSGITDQVPVLSGMKQTPVTLEASADIFQIIRLFEHFNKNGLGDKVNYNFSAVIDFSAWLPSMHVDKKGSVHLAEKK